MRRGVGIHAEQILPFFGLAATAVAPRRAKVLVWVATITGMAVFGVLVARGPTGRG